MPEQQHWWEKRAQVKSNYDPTTHGGKSVQEWQENIPKSDIMDDRAWQKFGRAADQVGGMMDPNLGRLPGADERGKRLMHYADTSTLREAPQAGMSDFRGDQAGYIGQLQAQARGEGPSLAKQQATDMARRSVAMQQALAAGGPPSQQAAGARRASQAGSAAMGSIMGASAQARAQEQLGALGQLGGALQGARGQDQALNLANVQAQLQQTGLNDANLRGLSDLELRNAISQQQGGLGAQGMFNELLRTRMGIGPDGPSGAERALGAGKDLAAAYIKASG